MRKLFVLVAVIVAAGFGQGMLVNGDFEQPIDVGWQLDTAGYVFVNRDVAYHPDGDYELLDSLLYQGRGRVYQIVDVPGPRLLLSFWAKFEIGGGSSTCWPVAGVTVGYYNDLDILLGETRIYHHNEYCTWLPAGNLSLIEVVNPDWSQYSLDIADELAQNLPGVDPQQIRKVGISVFDTTAGG